MKIIANSTFDEERALYGQRGIKVTSCNFDGPADGESALKECAEIEVERCFFNLRYPFWHVTNAVISESNMTDKCRAALWYDKNVTLIRCTMGGIKALRECEGVTLESCKIVSPEFLWRCERVKLINSTLESEYPLFECRDVEIDNLTMKGKYSFQYTENVVIKNSVLNTKDAFWHAKNVTVVDSVVRGEYLGWYSENVTFIRCKIIGTQPLCYCKGLVLEDCTMEETDLSFERSEVKASVVGSILSVKNPLSGSIVADRIDELIQQREYVDPSLVIIQANVLKTSK